MYMVFNVIYGILTILTDIDFHSLSHIEMSLVFFAKSFMCMV